MKIDSFKLDFKNGFIEFLTLKINCTKTFFFIFDGYIIIIFLHYRFFFFFNLKVILIKKNTVYKNV